MLLLLDLANLVFFYSTLNVSLGQITDQKNFFELVSSRKILETALTCKLKVNILFLER